MFVTEYEHKIKKAYVKFKKMGAYRHSGMIVK